MIDDWGQALYHDLKRYHGIDLIDTVRGEGPAPGLILSLIDGLPLGSMYVSQRLAKQRGGDWREYLDKGADWWLNADLYDAINQNTRATGNWKHGKAPAFPPYPRPGAPDKKPKSIVDLWQRFGGAQQAAAGGGLWQPVM